MDLRIDGKEPRSFCLLLAIELLCIFGLPLAAWKVFSVGVF
jgi:hypothetical protein